MKLATAIGVSSVLLAGVDAGYAPELKACHADSVKLRSAGLAHKGQSRAACRSLNTLGRARPAILRRQSASVH